MNPSINKVNQNVAKDATIQMYFRLSDDYDKYRFDYRSRSFTFLYRYTDRETGLPAINSRNCSPLGTWIYGQAMKRFHEIAGIDASYNYGRDTRCFRFDVGGTFFQITLRRDLRGIFLELDYGNEFKHLPRLFSVKSNETFENFDAEKYFKSKILPVYVYSCGFLSRTQHYYHCTKVEAAAKFKEYKYRDNVEDHRKDIEAIDEKSLRKALKRKNILLKKDAWVFVEDMRRANLNYKTRFDSPVYLDKAPNIFELYDDLICQYDDEEELMNEAEQIILGERNTIYI